MTTTDIQVPETVLENLKAELLEWRTDRKAIHTAKEAQERFENENRTLQREILTLQVNNFFEVFKFSLRKKRKPPIILKQREKFPSKK